jgi:AcrR family transcriptional regulator
MPQTRSRPRTENKFIDAVVAHLSEKGCDELGVNAIAKRAGADKVLIYRYFSDLNGLLETVAGEIEWLPEAATCLPKTESEALDALKAVLQNLRQTFTERPASLALLRWRKAVENPLTQRFNSDWKALWEELARSLAEGQGYDARRAWQTATSLAALLLEAELGGEAFNSDGLERAVSELQKTTVPATETAEAGESENLPTNLL